MNQRTKLKSKALAFAAFKAQQERETVGQRLNELYAKRLELKQGVGAHTRVSQGMDKGVRLESFIKSDEQRLKGVSLHDATGFSLKCRMVQEQVQIELKKLQEELGDIDISLANTFRECEVIQGRQNLLDHKFARLSQLARAEKESQEDSMLDDLHILRKTTEQLGLKGLDYMRTYEVSR
jgi:hypothetical protein